MLEGIVLLFVITHRAEGEAEPVAALHAVPGLHLVLGLLLGDIEFVGLHRRLKARLSLLGGQREIPVEFGLMVLIHVDIQLFRLPGAPGPGAGLVLAGVRRQGHALQARIRADPVRAVAIFAVHVVGGDDLGLVPADEAGHIAEHLALAPDVVLGPELQGVLVPEGADIRIVPHPAVPQPVEQFAAAARGIAGHVADRHLHAVLAGIGGDHAAEEEHLVVGMPHQDHQVRLFRLRLPALHPTRHFSLAQQVQFVDRQHLLRRGLQPDPEVGQALQRQVFMAIDPLRPGGDGPVLPLLYFHHPGFRLLHAAAQVDAVDGRLRLDLQVRPALLPALPHGLEVAVRGAVRGEGLVSLVRGGGLDGSRRRDVLRLLRQGRPGQEQQEQDETGDLFHVLPLVTQNGSAIRLWNDRAIITGISGTVNGSLFWF